VSRIWDVRVRTNIGRNSDRRAAIHLATPVILVSIDRYATRGLRAQFNTERVPDVPMRTDPREAIGIQAVPAARVTQGLQAPTLHLEIIGPLAAQVVLVVIGQPGVLGPRTRPIRRLDLGNLGDPATISRNRIPSMACIAASHGPRPRR
jgi:hypothetical protein